MAHAGAFSTARGLRSRGAMWSKTWVLLLALVVGGCGGEGSASSGGGGTAGVGGGGGAMDAGGSGGADDAGSDAIPPADGPFACGTETCAATQLCIHPCCGGAPPMCEDKPEGGTCPAGSHDGCSFGGCSSGDCCEMDPCTPPPPYCADQPDNGCMIQGHDCILLCA